MKPRNVRIKNRFQAAGAVLDDLLLTLPEREEKVFRLRQGIGDGYPRTFPEIGHIFNVTEERVRIIYYKAERKLLKHAGELKEVRDLPKTQVSDVIEHAKELTPYLITHLKSHDKDLRKLPWQVFEQLIAEFFASWGYADVRIVGTNSQTAADVIAMSKPDSTGVSIRYLIEVKRWKEKVGVEVVNQVIGAVVGERPRQGFHIGMIVSLAGFKDMRRYTPEYLKLLGIELRDSSDVKLWLRDYNFSKAGLWLPNPHIPPFRRGI